MYREKFKERAVFKSLINNQLKVVTAKVELRQVLQK